MNHFIKLAAATLLLPCFTLAQAAMDITLTGKVTGATSSYYYSPNYTGIVSTTTATTGYGGLNTGSDVTVHLSLDPTTWQLLSGSIDQSSVGQFAVPAPSASYANVTFNSNKLGIWSALQDTTASTPKNIYLSTLIDFGSATLPKPLTATDIMTTASSGFLKEASSQVTFVSGSCGPGNGQIFPCGGVQMTFTSVTFSMNGASVTAQVPEPSAPAMLLLGLAGVAFIARKRQA